MIYYGEISNCGELEDQAFKAFNNVLKVALDFGATKMFSSMIETVCDKQIENKRIHQAFENNVVFRMQIDWMDDIVRIVKAGQKTDYFSDLFYEKLLRMGLKLMEQQPSTESVKLIKAFHNHHEYI